MPSFDKHPIKPGNMALQGYQFEGKQISLEKLNPEGRILDLGGSGDGMIGLFGRPDQVSIDLRLDKLLNAPISPQ